MGSLNLLKPPYMRSRRCSWTSWRWSWWSWTCPRGPWNDNNGGTFVFFNAVQTTPKVLNKKLLGLDQGTLYFLSFLKDSGVLWVVLGALEVLLEVLEVVLVVLEVLLVVL